MNTIFQRAEITEPALFSPSDTTKKVDGFPEICVSTFSENIIQKFSSLSNTEKIAELYTANGAIPVYKIRYKDTDIAFYLSRIGAPACVAVFEEIVAMGAVMRAQAIIISHPRQKSKQRHTLSKY